MGKLCMPAEQDLSEADLLLNELQLRMTNAVLNSPRCAMCFDNPREVYLILAAFFEEQQREVQQAAAVALSVDDVRRIWIFCFDLLFENEHQNQNQQQQQQQGLDENHTEGDAVEDATAATLRSFLLHSPSIPLSALQQPAPPAPQRQRRTTDDDEHDNASAQPHCSLLSLVRPVLSALVELCYTVDLRLQRPVLHTDEAVSLSVVGFAALTASLVPTLDRVRAVRLCAQLAADVLDASWNSASTGERPLRLFLTVLSLFLASVWWVWGVLDDVHALPLRALAAQLMAAVDTLAVQVTAAAAQPSLTSASHSFFTMWLQSALRSDGGAVHWQLYTKGTPRTAEGGSSDDDVAHHVAGTAETTDALVVLSEDASKDTSKDECKDETASTHAAPTESLDFWVQLSS